MSLPNRYVCTVLEEMREQLKMLNEHSLDRYKSIHALMIEEAQTMVNRMEAALEDQRDVRNLLDRRSKLRKQVRALKKEKGLLEEGLDIEESEDPMDSANAVSEILRRAMEDE